MVANFLRSSYKEKCKRLTACILPAKAPVRKINIENVLRASGGIYAVALVGSEDSNYMQTAIGHEKLSDRCGSTFLEGEMRKGIRNGNHGWCLLFNTQQP